MVDADFYRRRHLIENFFGELIDFKRIAMRARETGASFAAMIYAAATIINSQGISTDPKAFY
jgi:transposase